MIRQQSDRVRPPALLLFCWLLTGTATAQQTLALSELEARGATIGKVNINIENVFDTSNPAEDKPLYRWANRVHRTTRPGVVRSIALFDDGDPVIAHQVEETARILRDRRFVAEASVEAGSYDPTTNSADINIGIRDAWSLEPDLKISRSGGENELGIGIVEDNLFGLGKSMTLSYSSDVDRDERFFGYSDANLFNSRKQLNASVIDLSDGNRFALATGRPFYSLDTRWSVWSEVVNDKRLDPIYDLGETIDEFRHETRFLSIQGGRSRGLVNGLTKRWIAGLTFEEDQFSPSEGFGTPLVLPEDRRLIYPWAGIEWIGDDFRQVSELNDMGRTEDVALGLRLSARLGIASPKLDSDRRAYLLSVSASRGYEPRGAGSLLLLSASASARSERDGIRNSVVRFAGSFMQRNLGDELFLASFRAVLANNLDAENQVLLGGDNDLRGYPLRYQSGERSMILSLEQRFYTDWYPFRLIRVGYAVFFDAGRVWGDDPRTTSRLGTLYDVGIGLRLTSPRSSGRSVVHIDLAFPIDAPADIDGIQLILEKKASF